MNRLYLLFLSLFFSASPGRPQDAPPAATATVFPVALLEGEPNFTFALMLQGDLRGNVGPCG
jgi:hypothetical protein